MSVILATNWWSLFIRGLAALALGVLTVLWRGVSLYHLTLVFFGYAMIDGVLNLGGAITAGQTHEQWWPLMLEALASIAAPAFRG